MEVNQTLWRSSVEIMWPPELGLGFRVQQAFELFGRTFIKDLLEVAKLAQEVTEPSAASAGVRPGSED